MLNPIDSLTIRRASLEKKVADAVRQLTEARQELTTIEKELAKAKAKAASPNPHPKAVFMTLVKRALKGKCELDVEYEPEGHGEIDIWVYHYGWENSDMGPGCHLIHERSQKEVLDILSRGLTKCECHECREAS